MPTMYLCLNLQPTPHTTHKQATVPSTCNHKNCATRINGCSNTHFKRAPFESGVCETPLTCRVETLHSCCKTILRTQPHTLHRSKQVRWCFPRFLSTCFTFTFAEMFPCFSSHRVTGASTSIQAHSSHPTKSKKEEEKTYNPRYHLSRRDNIHDIQAGSALTLARRCRHVIFLSCKKCDAAGTDSHSLGGVHPHTASSQ